MIFSFNINVNCGIIYNATANVTSVTYARVISHKIRSSRKQMEWPQNEEI